MSEPHTHTPEAHDVIACELVACTLGQRRRPELRVDPLGRIAAGCQRMAAAIGTGFAEALRRGLS